MSGHGGFPSDVAHLLGGAMLLLSFAMLWQRRASGQVTFYIAQAVLLAASAAWQGWMQQDVDLYLTALVTLAAKGVAIPRALRTLAPRTGALPASRYCPGPVATMALGALLVMLAILAVLPATLPAQALTREDLALALAVTLLGGLAMVARQDGGGQIHGFLMMENGVVLAAIGAPRLPLVLELSLALLVLVGFAIAGTLGLGRWPLGKRVAGKAE